MPPINLNHFYYFYEVARHGSFTRAARELLVSQSALSVQIKSLEEEMGGPLFDRRKGGVDLTESGELAFGTAESVFQELDQLLVELRASERQFTGVVTIGTVNSIGIYVLPEILSQFREGFPDIRLKVDFQEGERVIDLLVQGRVDFAIVPWNRRYSELDGTLLTTNKMFLVAPPGHPLLEIENLAPRELETYSFVGYQEGMVTRAMVDSLFKRMSLTIEYAIESTNAATIKHMVIAGMGLAVLPAFAVAEELRRGQLVRLEVPTFRMVQEMMLYHRKGRSLSRARAEFVDFLRGHFERRARRR
jgi:DNA-binding transcriptional LysR family regulator